MNDAKFIRVELPAQAVVIDTEAGPLIQLTGGGEANIELELVNAVTVENLSWVEQHTVTRIFDSVSHFVRFVGGGELRFAFSLEGDLLELSATGLRLRIEDDYRLVFGPSV